MFERFTTSARALVVQAVQEASASGARRVTDVHLLLALLDVDEPVLSAVFSELGVSPGVLSRRVRDFERSVPGRAGLSPGDVTALEGLGIDAETILEQAERQLDARRVPPDHVSPEEGPRWRVSRGQRARGSRGRARFQGSARRTLEASLRQALDLRHAEISAEHVLLGLLVVAGAAADYLGREGVDVLGARAAVQRARSVAAGGTAGP